MSRIASLPIVLLFIYLGFGQASAQIQIAERVRRSDPTINRSRGLEMLNDIKETVEKYYYDKNYRGIDIDVKFKEAREKIKTLDSNSQIFRVIAGVLLDFNDSHTRFYPPNRSERVQYGFSMQMIGSRCVVVDVVKGSNAEKAGMVAGDVITQIGPHQVNRDSLWVIGYLIYQLEPMTMLPVVVQKADKSERPLTIEATFKTLAERRIEAAKRRTVKRTNPYKCHKLSADVTACKLLTFSVDKKYIDQMMEEVSGSSKLILDLRGNGGGYILIEEYLTGHFFDREVKVGDIVTREKTDSRIAKPVAKRAFTGELTVLIDSTSASASEVFARVMQIEKRGKVIGDVSAGAVMTSYNMPMAITRGSGEFLTVAPYGLNITIGDMIMSDGKRLEHVGVIPDIQVKPSSTAIEGKHDPALAYAAEKFGVKMSAADAGKVNFLFRKTEDETIDDNEKDDKAEEKP